MYAIETPRLKYDAYEDKLTILTEKLEYLKIKDTNYPDIYTQVRFLYIFGYPDRQLCVEILEQVRDNHEIDITIYDNMGSIDSVMSRLLMENCIDSSFPIPNPITDKFPFTQINGKNQVTVKLKNLYLTEKGYLFHQNLLQKCDIILPNMDKEPFLYEEIIIPKLKNLLKQAEIEIGL